MSNVADLESADYTRFSRQIMLPEIGIEGQARIKNAKVLLIGVGGLGSPLALYLVAAGVGEIGLIDHDVVDESNLQRQILYTVEDIGLPKVVRAKQRLEALHPAVRIHAHDERLTVDNALGLIEQYDLVIDGTDNFETRFLVNDACVLSGKPNVYASIFRFEGQATVLGSRGGPCYRCLYRESPPAGIAPSCSEIGVLGVLPGVMACIQATEALKLITGVGETLSGRLLTFDALTMRFDEVRLEKDPDCPVCGEKPVFTTLQAAANSCTRQPREEQVPVPQMSVEHLSDLSGSADYLLIDVRETHERQGRKIDGSLHLPLNSLREVIGQLDREKLIIVYCETGGRSEKAARILLQHQFQSVFSLAGGMAAWVASQSRGRVGNAR